MGRRTTYAPGTFCWIDLSTSDREDSKRFYGELLGWHFDDRPGAGGTFSMALVDGDPVAALVDQAPGEVEQRIPSHWNDYVSVDDAANVVARVDQLGGRALGDPFEAGDAGLIGAMIDPTGAAIFVWEPKQHIGAGRVNEPGCLAWNDLATDDVDAASRFYSELFRWKIEEIDTGGGPRYWTIGNEGSAAGRNGGMRELGPGEQGVPPNWVPYFATESVDATLARAEKLGGSTLVPATEVPTGKFAGVRDPQGAAFSLVEGEFDD
jgi:predicted enzyme related to lactoylglutathione lyase